MTEDEAKAWVSARYDDAAVDRIARFAAIVVAESHRQNLIARSTLDAIWSRHIVDSLQLVPLGQAGAWLDVGTGAGFPGLAVAVAEPDRRVMLVEPRRLRADYLAAAVTDLGLANVTVIAGKVETVRAQAALISARAVSQVASLFASAVHCAQDDTLWLLPKGRDANAEVAEARRTWHGVFHVKQSITNPESAIVVAHGVRRR